MTFEEYTETEDWKQTTVELERLSKIMRRRSLVFIYVYLALVVAFGIVVRIITEDMTSTVADIVLIAYVVFIILGLFADGFLCKLCNRKYNEKFNNECMRIWQIFSEDFKDYDFYKDGAVDIYVQCDGARGKRGELISLTELKITLTEGEKVIHTKNIDKKGKGYIDNFFEYLVFKKIKQANEKGFMVSSAQLTIVDKDEIATMSQNEIEELYVDPYILDGKLTPYGKDVFKRLKEMGADI